MTAEVEEQMKSMLDLAKMQAEPLHLDLVPYVTEGAFGTMIAHPLVHMILPINGLANRAYEEKRKALTEALGNEDWHAVVFLHEKPYRLDALIDYVTGRDGVTGEVLPVTKHDSPEVRALVADVWTDSENIHQFVDEWMQITSGWVEGDPILFGDPEEFAALPDRIEVWRGDCDDGGWSWSTERHVAVFFAKRWSANHNLLHGWVEKRHVFGYLTQRSEHEVMVRREYVQDLTSIGYPYARPY